MPSVTIEGYSLDELFSLPREELDAFVLREEPSIFRIGSASILGRFAVQGSTLILELAHIDGGGEGGLPTLVSAARRFGSLRGLHSMEWRVHAISCANPNLRLRKILEQRGFSRQEVPGVGECYLSREPL